MDETLRKEIAQMIEDAIKNHKHNAADSLRIRGQDLMYAPQTAIADPTGGATEDAEARAAIELIIDTLEALQLTLPA